MQAINLTTYRRGTGWGSWRWWQFTVMWLETDRESETTETFTRSLKVTERDGGEVYRLCPCVCTRSHAVKKLCMTLLLWFCCHSSITCHSAQTELGSNILSTEERWDVITAWRLFPLMSAVSFAHRKILKWSSAVLHDVMWFSEGLENVERFKSEGLVSLCRATTKLDVLSRCGWGVGVLWEFCSLDWN